MHLSCAAVVQSVRPSVRKSETRVRISGQTKILKKSLETRVKSKTLVRLAFI